MTKKNIKAGFSSTGLVPHDSQAVLSKLNVVLRTPTPTRPPPAEADPWVSQTLHNPTEALSQTKFIRNKIACHQGSSPTSIFTATAQLAKGTEVLAHKVSLLVAEVDTLRKANEALSKRKRAKRTYVQHGGALSIGEATAIVTQREVDEQIQAEKPWRGGGGGAGLSTTYCCSKCGKTGHNARTCKIDVEVPEVHNEQ
jgi:hypothetical protein